MSFKIIWHNLNYY